MYEEQLEMLKDVTPKIAEVVYKLYTELTKAGFSEEQAMQIVKNGSFVK